MTQNDRWKTEITILEVTIVVLVFSVSVLSLTGTSACATGGRTAEIMESQPDEDDDVPWIVLIAGVLAGVLAALIAWFFFNPPHPKGSSKRTREGVTIYECLVTPGEPLVEKEVEIKVVLENTGPTRSRGEHDVEVRVFDEYDTIGIVKAGSFHLEPGTRTELPITWTPKASGEHKITIIIVQGSETVDLYSFSKMVEEEETKAGQSL